MEGGGCDLGDGANGKESAHLPGTEGKMVSGAEIQGRGKVCQEGFQGEGGRRRLGGSMAFCGAYRVRARFGEIRVDTSEVARS